MLVGSRDNVHRLKSTLFTITPSFHMLPLLRKSLFTAALFALIAMSSLPAIAQSPITMPDGEVVVAVNIIPDVAPQTDVRISATRSRIYASALVGGVWAPNKLIFDKIPNERRINDASLRAGETGTTRGYAVLLDNGDVLTLTLDLAASAVSGQPQLLMTPQLPQNNGFNQQQYQKVVYSSFVSVLYNGNVYTNKLDGSGYILDSAGMRSGIAQDISLDLQANLVAGTARGIYHRNTQTGKWQRNSAFDSTFTVRSIFYARDLRIFASTNNRGTFLSTDNGTTWKRDTNGLANASVARFADDVNKVVYAVINAGNGATTLFRKSVPAGGWSRIDAQLTTAAGGTLRIFDIASNNSVELATSIGMMSSFNAADSWSNTSVNISAEDIYSLQFMSGGAQVASTNVGVFRKTTGAWSQVFPTSGFNAGRVLFRAQNPSRLSLQLAASGNMQGVIMSSSDEGQTWFADTVGLSEVPAASGFTQALFSMDRSGKKYIALGSPLEVYSTPSWGIDTVGLDWPSGSGTASAVYIGSDHANNVYLSAGVFTAGGGGFVLKQGMLYRRSGGGMWIDDSNGFDGNAVSGMAFGKTAIYATTLFADGTSKLYKRGSGSWQLLPSSPTAYSDASAMCVDSSNALWVGYSAVFQGADNTGIVATTDEGATWQNGGLAGLTIRGLTSTSDGTYAYTSRGAYKLSLTPLKVASVQFSKHEIDFGTVEVGMSKDTTITVTNGGNDTLRVYNLRAPSLSFVISPNSFELAPGGSRSVTISFKPQNGGQYSNTVRPVSNTAPDTLLLLGNGKAANAKLLFDGSYIDLGTASTNKPKDTVIVVGNSGTDTLIVTNVTCVNPAITATPTAFKIAPSGTTNLTIRWAPTTPGSVVTHLRFFSNAPADSIRLLADAIAASVDDPKYAESLRLVLGPNPVANDNAQLSFTLQNAMHCRIDLLNSRAQEIAELMNANQESGTHSLSLASHLNALSNGVYYLRLQTPEGRCTVALVVSR